MHALNNEWRLVLAGFVLCVVISFVRSVMRKRSAVWFDVTLSVLAIGFLVYVLH